MNRIDNLFTFKQKNILSVFFPAGYPALNDTLPILNELQKQGVDMVEIGIPFSDPLADGVVIQKASSQALSNGISLRNLFEQLRKMRPKITIPVVLMGYLNPILHFGFDAFCQECVRVGVDGVIIPDLPFADYQASYKHIADRYNLRMTMLITPETSPERIRLIDSHTSGFLYMVSTAATTGTKHTFDQQTHAYFRRIESMQLKNHRLIGFGISNSDTFHAACEGASGAIIGSHFVRLLATEDSIEAAVKRLKDDLGC